MTNNTEALTRREALSRAGRLLAAITVTVVGAHSGAALAKPKAAKDDFYFQETPNDDGKNCTGCVNFTAKSTGKYGADSGDCALLEGDVCNHCYCQGWADKKTGKRAGT